MTLVDVDLRVSVGDLDLEVALTIDEPSTVVVVGPNGAGKTTLLRAICGLQPIDAGRVSLGDRIVDEPATGRYEPPEQRLVGFVPQDSLLFPHLTVEENVAFGLRARGSARRPARERARALLDALGVAHLGSARPAALSGGQARRVAVARALAVRPGVLLLDEPLSGLDVEGRSGVHAAISGPAAASCRIVVTHDRSEALTLADRVVVLEDGQVTQTGTVEAVTRAPATPFVTQALGSNVVRGTAEGADIVLTGGTRLTAATAGQGPVLVTVAPAAVALHLHRPEGSPRNVWPTIVADVDRSNADRNEVRLGPPLPFLVEVTPASVAELGLEPGREVWASVKATELVVHEVAGSES